MSVQDLIAKWEDALVQALSNEPACSELSDKDLETVRSVVLRSGIRAGGYECWFETGEDMGSGDHLTGCYEECY